MFLWYFKLKILKIELIIFPLQSVPPPGFYKWQHHVFPFIQVENSDILQLIKHFVGVSLLCQALIQMHMGGQTICNSSLSPAAHFQLVSWVPYYILPFPFLLPLLDSLLSPTILKHLLIHLPFFCSLCAALLSLPTVQFSDKFSLVPSCLLSRHNSTQHSRYFVTWPIIPMLFLKIMWISIMPLIILWHYYVCVCYLCYKTSSQGMPFPNTLLPFLPFWSQQWKYILFFLWNPLYLERSSWHTTVCLMLQLFAFFLVCSSPPPPQHPIYTTPCLKCFRFLK